MEAWRSECWATLCQDSIHIPWNNCGLLTLPSSYLSQPSFVKTTTSGTARLKQSLHQRSMMLVPSETRKGLGRKVTRALFLPLCEPPQHLTKSALYVHNHGHLKNHINIHSSVVTIEIKAHLSEKSHASFISLLLNVPLPQIPIILQAIFFCTTLSATSDMNHYFLYKTSE